MFELIPIRFVSHPSSTETAVNLIRMLLIMLPAVVLTYQFVHREHSLMRWVGALFAHIWQFQWRMILLATGVQLSWWHFQVTDIVLYGVPADMLLGCGLLLGVLPRIIAPKLPLLMLVVADVVLMLWVLPLEYSANKTPYLLGISLLVIVPSHLLARWTERDQHIYLRSLLQNIGWSVLLLWLFPSIVFNLTDDSWQPLLQRSIGLNTLYLLPMLIPAVLLLDALYEFAKHGKGTAFPYDAPKYLVTTGVYRYLSNPMQTGIVMMMLLWGAILESGLIMLSAPIALILFLVFKNVCNGSCRIGLCNPEWERYQRSVPKWIPRKSKLE